MRQEFEILRESARCDPNEVTRDYRLSEIDEMERQHLHLEKELAELKKMVEADSQPRKIFGIRVGTTLEWLMALGLPTVMLILASWLNLTDNETAALTGTIVLVIGGICIVAVLRLRARVRARKDVLRS